MPSLTALAGFLALVPSALAGWNPNSKQNIAVYWGQNSANSQSTQQRLSFYCDDDDINIIDIAFLNGITPPMTNFANAGDKCTPFSDNPFLLSCPEIEADIKTCQANGKTILLSLGGDSYTQGGWSSPADAEAAADEVWAMFGPVQSDSSAPRPFGSAVVDGFDFDFEAATNNLAAFGAQLRKRGDDAGGKKFYLSAAPQCFFPDAAEGALIDAVPMDWVQIQFYNNPCGVNAFTPGAEQQNNYNYQTWEDWAKTSPNPNVKLLVGIPAGPSAGHGYVSGEQLKSVFEYSKQFDTFAGAMMWDMSQLYQNSGFEAEVVEALK
ncbi:family 18 glycoside hydrolase [Trichoderma aethiopicum]